MGIFKGLAVIVLLFTFGLSHADGMPLPWPFPWAKECPVDWGSMQGSYVLEGSSAADNMQINIVADSKSGTRTLYISRYSQQGQPLFEGFADLAPDQRQVTLYLTSYGGTEAPVLATLNLHYSNNETLCTMDKLVPILTIEQREYRLVRLPTKSHNQMQ